jgi:hypothetical protein
MKRAVPSKTVFILAIILVFCAQLLQAQGEKPKPFKDASDSAFDISYYLYNLHGFLPVPSIITEPAVGYGGILAGAFFIPKKNPKSGKFNMPDIVGLGGGYTQNNTWFFGGGYFGFWKNDHIRYRGAGGYADVKLKYYGRGDGFLNKNPADFTIQAFGLVQQAIFRLGESRFMLGGKYIFTKTKVTAFEDSKLPWVNPKEFDLTNSGIGIIAEYENFDNIFSPEKGLRVNVSYSQYLEFLGSDRNFGRLSVFAHYYLPVIPKKWISGFRTEYQTAIGDPPFYAYPFLILRGVPAMRYQGKYTILGETEQLVMITKRWGVVGFAGYGQTFNDKIEGNNAWNAGGGFRYLIARLFGLKMGIDVARGPEDWAFYVIFGSAWMR